MKKIYIITGGAGFIGSNLAKQLIKGGNTVYVLDDLSSGFERNIPPEAVFYKTDVSNADLLTGLNIPGRIDCIFHLAAQSSGEASFEDPSRDIDINYKGTYNILKFARLKQCKRFIFTSSMSVYGKVSDDKDYAYENSPCNPLSYYGCNKLASEKLIALFAKNANIEYTIFRLFSVYGPGQNMHNIKQGIVSIYFSYLLNSLPIQVKGSLDRFRDFVYIDDVIDVLIKSENNKNTYGDIFNLGTSVKTSVRELLSFILAAYKKNDFSKWVIVKGNTPGDINGCIANIDKLKAALGWRPKYHLKSGIVKMKDWIEETKELWVEKCQR